MRLRMVAPAVAVLGLVPVLYLLFPTKLKGDGIPDFSGWTPTQQDIGDKIGVGGGGSWKDERHKAFTRMFQQRFRDNGHAVGLKFLNDRTLKAMFAPVIPKWDMARVSLQAEAEAYAIFGRGIDVDVYETYITAPMRKVAEVRRVSDKGPVQVRFDPRFAVVQLNERREREAARLRRSPPTNVTPSAAPVTPLGRRRLDL